MLLFGLFRVLWGFCCFSWGWGRGGGVLFTASNKMSACGVQCERQGPLKVSVLAFEKAHTCSVPCLKNLPKYCLEIEREVLP